MAEPLTERVADVRELADTLTLLHPGMRAEAANQLRELGLRAHPERAVAPGNELEPIVAALYFAPAPLRRPLATLMYAAGVRYHPELATAELEYSGPKMMGNHRPARPVRKNVIAEAQAFLEEKNPELAAQIAAARAAAERGDTSRRDALGAQMREQLPADWRTIADQIDKADFK